MNIKTEFSTTAHETVQSVLKKLVMKGKNSQTKQEEKTKRTKRHKSLVHPAFAQKLFPKSHCILDGKLLNMLVTISAHFIQSSSI